MQSFEGLNNLQKLMGHFSFWCLKIGAEKMLSKLLFKFYQLPCFSLIYTMFLYVCARVEWKLKKRMQHVTDISIFCRAFLQLIPAYDLHAYRWEGLDRS
jgi:hypothetical protein